jgi:hypothetical protein
MSSAATIYGAQERRLWWPTPKKPVSWKKALVDADADWEVRTVPLFAQDEGVLVGPAPEHFGLLLDRADKKLVSVVGSRFHPVQNEELFEFASKLGELKGGWVLRDGRVVGVTVAAGEGIKLPDRKLDPIVPFLHVVNWHGGGALEVHPSFAIGSTVLTAPDSTISIRHLKNLPRHPEVVAQVKKDVSRRLVEFAATLKQLATTRPTDNKLFDNKLFDKVYASVWPEPKGVPKGHATWKIRKDDVSWIYEQLGITSMAGLYLAFCEWAQWGRPFRGTGGVVAKNDLLRAEEVLFGQTREIGETVLKTLTKGKKS